jgi:hypothetical protein
MNENQSVSVVQKKRRNIYFFRAKMCAPSLELLPPLLLVPSIIVSKNPGGDDESKSDKHKRERERDLKLWHHLTSNSSIFVQ